MADESPESPQRWTAKRRVALVVSILKGETSIAAAAGSGFCSEQRTRYGRWERQVYPSNPFVFNESRKAVRAFSVWGS